MNEKAREALKLQFDKWLRPEFYGARITWDVGLDANWTNTGHWDKN